MHSYAHGLRTTFVVQELYDCKMKINDECRFLLFSSLFLLQTKDMCLECRRGSRILVRGAQRTFDPEPKICPKLGFFP